MHLALDVTPHGALRLTFGEDVDPTTLENTCALDVADLGGVTLDDVAAVIGISRQRVEQLEKKALTKVAKRLG